MANTELAQKVLNLIRLNRQAFDMGTWFGSNELGPVVVELDNEGAPACGTVMCLAGWAAVASGYVLKSGNNADGTSAYYGAFEPGSNEIVEPEGYPDSSGTMVYSQFTNFEKLGSELLGITFDQAENLFHTTDYKAEQVLERLASGEPFDWDYDWSEIEEYEEEDSDW